MGQIVISQLWKINQIQSIYDSISNHFLYFTFGKFKLLQPFRAHWYCYHGTTSGALRARCRLCAVQVRWRDSECKLIRMPRTSIPSSMSCKLYSSTIGSVSSRKWRPFFPRLRKPSAMSPSSHRWDHTPFKKFDVKYMFFPDNGPNLTYFVAGG